MIGSHDTAGSQGLQNHHIKDMGSVDST